MNTKVVRITGAGGPEVLEIAERFIREPGPDELLIEVAAAGLNRADVLQRRGFYPAPAGAPADVPGLEYAGTVVAIGSGVLGIRPGDRVMGIVAGGAMARHLLVHEREAIPIPMGMPLEQAAAIPEVFLTAWDALFVQASLGMGEVALIHAVGSGVGTAALQLCLLAGARPIGTTRTAWKLERCEDMGLLDGVLVEGGSFSRPVREKATSGADVILDTVGASYADENARSLGTSCRWVMVGLLGGNKAEIPLGMLLASRATLIGTVLRSRPFEEKALLAQRFAREILPLFEAGRLRPIVDSIVPMKDVAEAHRRLEENETFGKIILAW